MDDTVTLKNAVATVALDAAEERQQKIAAKKAEYRLQWQRNYREYRELMEIERFKRAIEVVQTRMGRPQTIPEEMLTTIIELHAQGETLLQSCAAAGISRAQFMKRCNESGELRARLTQAREDNAHAKIDGSWEIARVEPDVERARLLVELAQWEASKVLPHLFGERLQVAVPDGVVFSLNIGQLAEKQREKVIEAEQLVG